MKSNLLILFVLLNCFSASAQWTNIGPAGPSLSAVSFYDANLGYACGSAGSLYRTLDGGITWTVIPNFTTPGLLNRLRSVVTPDRTMVLVIWETPNQTQPTGSFLSSNSGNQFLLQSYGTYNNMTFRVPNIGLQVGGAGTLRFSLNNGNLWVPVTSGTQYNLRDGDCSSPNDCFVVGDNGTMRKNVSGDLYTWRAVNSTTSAQLNGVYFDTPLRGYIVGNNGTALRTLDGGATWIPMNLGTTVNLNDVRFLDSDIGFIAGDFGTVFATTDRGVTWRSEPTNTFENLNSITTVGNGAVANATWIAGEAGTVLKRTRATVTGNRTASATNWEAYPNPFSTVLKVDVPGTAAAHIEVSLIDCMGRQVFTQRLAGQASRQTTSLDLPSTLDPGVYQVQLKMNNQVTETRRLVRMP